MLFLLHASLIQGEGEIKKLRFHLETLRKLLILAGNLIFSMWLFSFCFDLCLEYGNLPNEIPAK